MIIIIEGPDGSGKSTLAVSISKMTGWPVVHKSAPSSEAEYKAMVADYIKTLKEHKNLILDRAWYSEMAYGPTMRDKSAISYPEMYELERVAASRGGAMIIYCTDKPSVLWHRCQKRGEDYVKYIADFTDICEAYDEIMDVPHLIPVVKYDYKDL